MAFTKLSTVSVNERKKCLVKSGKDKLSGYLAKYVDILEMGSKHLYVMSYEMRV